MKMLIRKDFNLKLTENTWVPLKNVIWDFQNSPPFKRSACFYETIIGDFSVFVALVLIQVFWKTKTFVKILGYYVLLKVLWLKT